MTVRLLVCVACVIASLLPALPAAADPPPLSAYAAMPIVQAPRLSPDGNALAMISAAAGKPVFKIQPLDGRPPHVFAAPQGWSPSWIVWKNATLAVAGVRGTFMTGEGRPRDIAQLLLIAADGSKIMPVDLTFAANRMPLIADRLLSTLPGDPDHILMQTLSAYGPDVSRIDVRNARLSQAQDSRDRVFLWFSDEAGAVRAGKMRSSTIKLGMKTTLLARASTSDSWHALLDDVVDGTLGHPVAGFDPANPDLIWLSETGAGGHTIIRAYSISTGKPADIVAQSPGADVDTIAADDNHVVGFRTLGIDERFTYFDPAWQHDASSIGRALDGGTVELLDRSPDGKHVLAAVHDDALPTEYWVLDRSGSKSAMHRVARAYESVPPCANRTCALDFLYRARWRAHPCPVDPADRQGATRAAVCHPAA